ncbi:MAG: DUF2336 domain-containing protein [Rhodobacterales bacterium]|nr:DUF2336 domain-containing protein [Rhodobacterales bacterium]
MSHAPVTRLNKDQPLSYDEVKALAQHPEAAVRSRLAGRDDVAPEVLYFLAQDDDAQVRRAIAANTATPRQADLVLAKDREPAVRGTVAVKVAEQEATGIPETDKLREMAAEALQTLAEDQEAHIRQILAEALKDVIHAPADVIRKLAWDTEIKVSGPVLASSPVLTDADLVAIVEAQPAPGAAQAIAARPEVSEAVADAIVDGDDVDAIAALLDNPSAQIREETLDALIDRAPAVEPWHRPLVDRPRLPTRAASRVAGFVAQDLLDRLARRADLDAETLDAVKAEVSKRISEGPRGGNGDTDSPSLIKARRLHADGKLDEEVVSKALRAEDRAFVIAALAVLSDVPPSVVQKALMTHSAKAVVALAWKSGLSMRTAEALQIRLARLGPGAIIRAGTDGTYPLRADELDWQFEFIRDMAV